MYRIEGLLDQIQSLANKFNKDREDLVQHAILEIIKAIPKYDKNRGEFAPYALKIAFYAMIQYYNTNHIIHVPRSMQHYHKKNQLKGGERVAEQIKAARKTIAIDDFLFILKDNSACFMIDIDEKDTTSLIQTIIKKLPSKPRKILKLRSKGLTLDLIAKSMNLTRSRINQIEHEAFLEIRKQLWQRRQ